jgi:hypothetical protein
MVFNVTFNNVSVISWWLDLLVEETSFNMALGHLNCNKLNQIFKSELFKILL